MAARDPKPNFTAESLRHLGQFPLDRRSMMEHSVVRRNAMQTGQTAVYHGGAGRVGGWAADGKTSVPSLVAEVPAEVGQDIHAAGERFQALLRREYFADLIRADPFSTFTDEQVGAATDVVDLYPPQDVHISVAQGETWFPQPATSLFDHVQASIEGLDLVTRHLQPFVVRGRGINPVPNCLIWRVLENAERFTHAKAAILHSEVPAMQEGVSPHHSPVGPKIDGRWGQTAHATVGIFTKQFDGQYIRRALHGWSLTAADATFEVTTFKLNANVHQGSTIYPAITLAEFELGRGLFAAATEAEVARVVNPSQGLGL